MPILLDLTDNNDLDAARHEAAALRLERDQALELLEQAGAATLEAQERAGLLERALIDIRATVDRVVTLRFKAKLMAHTADPYGGKASTGLLGIEEDLEAVRLRMKAILDGAL